MSRTRKAAITAVFSYAQFAMAIIPGLVLVPLILRCLGARTYGLWLTIGEVLAYALMADPGILHILPWIVAEADGSSDRQNLRRLVSNAFAGALLAGAGYFIVAATGWMALPDVIKLTTADRALLGPPLAFLVVVTALTYPLRVFRAVLLGLQDVTFVGGLAVAEIAINVVIMALMLVSGYQVWALVCAASISATVIAIANGLRVLYVAPDLLTSLERPTMAGIRPLLRGGAGAWLSGFGWMLLSASNNIVISFLGHPEWVPIFSCTAKMSLLVTQLAWVMPDSGLVGLAQLHGEQPRSPRKKQMVGALVQLHLLMAGGAACAVLAFNPVFVGRWVGDSFFGGMRLNALLAAGVVVYGLIHGLLSAAAVVGDRLRVGVISLLNGVAQCALAILFGRMWGLSGVAAAGLLAGLGTAVPTSLLLLRRADAVSLAVLARDVVGGWASRAAVLLAMAAAVGVFHKTLGPWLTASAAIGIGLIYLWQMRPLYHILPIDPGWVRWLVSLRLLPPPAVPVEPA